MLRPVLIPASRVAFTCMVAAALLWSAPGADHARQKPPARTATAKKTPAAHPAVPKSPIEVQQDLATVLHAGALARDAVAARIQGENITLSGVVHSAEHKGLATRQARLIATRDGWTNFHVLNQITVDLPPL